MNDISLTDEQQAVIHHPLGRHARVLAVAGSGNITLTRTYRVRWLISVSHCSFLRKKPPLIRITIWKSSSSPRFFTSRNGIKINV